MSKNRDDYADIIHLPHHVSKKRPQMSMADRAAQFSPFAALTGYEDKIHETARRTSERLELAEDELAVLDAQIRHILAHLEEQPEVDILYFQPDATKEGGAYLHQRGHVKKLDTFSRQIKFTDGTILSLDDIYEITSIEK